MKRITIRLDEKHYQHLKFLADSSQKSVNAVVESLIEDDKNKYEETQKKIEFELHELKKMINETNKNVVTGLLLNREIFKESAKCGFLAKANIGEDQDLIEQMNGYVSEKDKATIKILKGDLPPIL
ncbi:hypothetical protein [Silvanigrella sp.]|uniref:hypothetical protein n=1 Tax=Silvanigrella sp. TaxID=2024976 RepID=UPI0037CA2C52